MQASVGVDYSGYDVGLKHKPSKKDCMKKSVLEVNSDTFTITKHLNSNTIYYPVEMLENKVYDNNRNILQLSQEGLSDGVIIKGYETELDYVSVNSIYVHALLEGLNFSNIVVAVRDYYTEDDMKNIGKAFSVRKDSKVIVIPASLAFVIDYKTVTVSTVDHSLIVSTRGNKVVFTVYKSSKEAEKFSIENILQEVYDDVSDNGIRRIIFKNIKKQIIEHTKANGISEGPFTCYPILDKEEEIYSRTLDLSEVYEDIKNAVLSNHTSYTIRQIFINDDEKRFPLLDVSINVKSIVNEINECIDESKVKFEGIVQNIKNTLLEKDIALNSVYFITDFFCFFERSFDLEGANKVQNGFIRSGCSIYDKEKLDLKNIKKYETYVYIETGGLNIFKEIKYKKEAKETASTILNSEGLDKLLSNLKQEEYAGLQELIANTSTYDFKTAKQIVDDYNALVRKNIKVGIGRQQREANKTALEKTLNTVLLYETSDIPLWNSGLKDRVETIKKWFDENKDNESVLGFAFETKCNLLEGLVQTFRNKLAKAKQEEEKLKREEEERLKKEEEEKLKKEEVSSNGDVAEGQDKKEEATTLSEDDAEATNLSENNAAGEEKKEEATKLPEDEEMKDLLEETKNLFENNGQQKDSKNFDFASFKEKFDNLMKDQKYKKLMEDMNNKKENKSSEMNPELEPREL